MANETVLDGQELKVALEQFAEVRICSRKNGIHETTTEKRKLSHVDMYFIAQMVLVHIMMMCRYRGRLGRKLGSHVFTDKCSLQHLNQYPC